MNFIEKFFENQDIIFVGEFKSIINSTNLINFEWNIDSKTKKDKRGRVYFFIEKDINDNVNILKIGKSNDKSGLNGTIGFYTSTLSGTPSFTRYALHHLISEKLLKQSKILVYCKFSDSIKTSVKGIFEEYNLDIPLDITYIEELCLKEFYNYFNNYPEWNFQESNKELPIHIMENFGIFIQNKNLKRKK